MPALASDLRRQLENVITDAREKAEVAARAALKRMAVDAPKPFDHFSDEQRALRNRLRARARQAGDRRKPNGEQEIDQLTQELAYEYWHRMLFARFLAENHLLMHPDGVAVSLAECDELAKHEGAENGFVLAARYASRMLPQIFRTDDVLLEVDFPINDRLPLEKLLASLPTDTFTADDSLGWVYQFWQAKKKDEVNKSGEKIDGRTLPAVTQLFTEPYMVKFLLHNTIGAWWRARHGVKGPPGGAGVPTGQAPVEMEYMRWRDDGTPAAGTFDGWPDNLKDFTMLDPCCGSGHFLVEAFNLLVPMRMHDEGLSAQEACDAVLAENLFGLELDPRCTQIAAFALALAAWKFREESGEPLGYRPLPPLNIACSGQSVTGRKEEWLALANGDSRLKEGMDKLYDLFRQAPHLGSLIDPRREGEDLFVAGFAELQPLLEKALAKEKVQQDADATAVGVAAQGIAKAAEMLGQEYTLVATNVPYLTAKKHGEVIQTYLEEKYNSAKHDIANAFVLRALESCRFKSTVALVAPQNILFLTRASDLRRTLLTRYTWYGTAKLGENAFQSSQAAGAFPALFVITSDTPSQDTSFFGFDCLECNTPSEKAAFLREAPLQYDRQLEQLQNPDNRVAFGPRENIPLLEQYAILPQGIKTGDDERWRRCFWEVVRTDGGWERYQSTVEDTELYGGRYLIIDWCTKGRGMIRPRVGNKAVGHRGVAISQMRSLPATLYTGEQYDSNVAVVAPKDPSHLPALWAFCSSKEYHDLVREIDQTIKVTNATLGKVPFDLRYWQEKAEEAGPLPEPISIDPTQWLFKGDVATSTDPLQVAVARLLSYRWPEQPKEPDAIDALADEDGIVCIPAVRSEKPAAERLLDVLRAAYSSEWSDAILHKLLTDAGCKPGTSLDEWLRDTFFEQHWKRFHNRPFIWHIWDGRKDGFSCLVNYHKLNHKLLETLTYSYLQDWITAQAAAAKEGKTGADLRLVAAQELQNKLKLILAGEPPYDIFVRWKPSEEQPIGWNPDLNDGVRSNIRPFMTADVLRKKPSINWSKDRGKEPERDQDQYPWFWKDGKFTGDRVNDYHLTNAQKRAAQAA
jgi:hypothetical protein